VGSVPESQKSKEDRRDGERTTNKLCSLGDDWLRSIQVCAVRPISELIKQVPFSQPQLRPN
jgi:hypothetical protein